MTSVTPGAAQAASEASATACHDDALPESVTVLPEVSTWMVSASTVA